MIAHISIQKVKTLMSHQEIIDDILHDVIFVHKKPVFLSERPQQHTLLKVDFDFKYHVNYGLIRIHTLDDNQTNSWII